MFCEKCGTQNPDGSMFCQNCGNKMAAEPAPAAAAAPVAAPAAPAAKPVNTKKALIIMGIVAAVIIAIVAVVLIITAPTKIVLDNYITVEIEGYDGIGRANLNWDSETMLTDMCKDLEEAEAKQLTLALMLGQKLDLELDRDEELFNGETINLVLTYDEAFFEMYNLEIQLKKTEFAVEGLKESTMINPFDFLKITYEGFAPYASLTLENTSTDPYLKENISFYANNSYNLEEGESFTVSVSYSEYDAQQNGFIITSDEKEYTATGLSQPKEVDLFDYLVMEFTGVDGSGQMTFGRKEGYDEDPFFSRVSFRASSTYNLTTGDSLTFTVSYPSEPERYGYKVKAEEKTITVPQLGVYIKDLNAVSDNVRNQLVNALKDKATAVYTGNEATGYLYTGTSILSKTYDLEDYTDIKNLKLTHTYHCEVTSWGSTYNRVGIFFTVELGGHKTEAANCTAYGYACIDNAILKADGTLEAGWEEALEVYSSVANSYELFQEKWCINDTMVIEEIK